MTVTFHPSQVRTREQIVAASQHRKAVEKAKHLQNLFLVKDNEDQVDFHTEAGRVAARVRESRTTLHHGYVETNGDLDIRSSVETNPGAEDYEYAGIVKQRLARSADGLTFLEGAVQQSFEYKNDGSILYSVETVEAPDTEHSSATFTPGSITSPEELEAAETYRHMQSRFTELEVLSRKLDGDENLDLNETVGVVATSGIKVEPDFAFAEARYGLNPLANREVQEFARERTESWHRGDPVVSGYIAIGRAVDSNLDWSFDQPGEPTLQIHYQRSDDMRQAQIETSVEVRAEYLSSKFWERTSFLKADDGRITVSRESKASGYQRRPMLRTPD